MNSLSLKIVIRCKNFLDSRRFYTDILKLPVLQEWGEEQGKGCVFGFGEHGNAGFLEIYEMTKADPRFRAEFLAPMSSDKIDIQLGMESLDAWIERLDGLVEFLGPATLPWGQRWIQLRDPDGVRVAIYEGLDPSREENVFFVGGNNHIIINRRLP